MKVRDIGVLGAVILIVAMLIIPLPPWMLSFLIVINITLGLIVLLTAMSMKEALDFSIFPSVILLLTLFRLGLSVSTTRAILANGDAGSVVETFGDFVVGGNILVGLVVFLILVLIQFIVITKGAERVAEVAARFTLDAMPGKQMSIDADLNAGGIISEKEARERREKVAGGSGLLRCNGWCYKICKRGCHCFDGNGYYQPIIWYHHWCRTNGGFPLQKRQLIFRN